MTDDAPRTRTTKLYGAIERSGAAGPHSDAERRGESTDPPDTLADSTADLGVAAPLVGTLLDRYRVGDMLGRGGMGEVLSARDEQIGRWVAIKRLRVERPTPEILARFLREARIQGRLEHPAVVPVHELWTGGTVRAERAGDGGREALAPDGGRMRGVSGEGGQPFFVMKQLTGTTLADVLPRLAGNDLEALVRFPLQRLLRAFADVCLAIEFAHTRGVVHRDLKPSNIVLGDFGEIYVLDWGIARVTGEDDHRASFADIPTVAGTETVVGAILGTPGYISPEQARGEPDLDGRADVYALGCILFELLTLQPLHPGGQAGIASALAGIDARPSQRTPEREIPPELEAICVRATQLDRMQRFQTARGLGEAVQRYLDGNRDLALRRELARNELDTARRALATGNGATERRDALRAAARALALDPTDRDPADLVAQLMLQPPAEVPVEVDAELDRLDNALLRTSARFSVFAALAYLAFFPMLYGVGFRATWFVIACPSLSVMMLAIAIFISPRNAYVSGYLAVGANLAMFAIFARITSPILIGPGPAIIMVTLLASHRRLIRPWLLAALTAFATLSPWLLELVGVLPVSTVVSGSDLILHTAADHLAPGGTLAALVAYLVALLHLAALLSRLQDDERRGIRRALQLQSWQLRQLVPRPASIPPRQ